MRDGKLVLLRLSLLDDPRAPLRSAVESGPLEELMESMSKRGLLQPIGAMERDGRYEVVWGHRRTMAARELRWETIPARIVERDGGGLLLDRAHENLMRADLSPVEEGQLCEALVADNGGDIERAARSIGRSVGWVDSRLDLLRWPEDVRVAVDSGSLSRAAAKPLSAVTDDAERAWLLRHAIADGATERVTRAWFQSWQVSGHVNDPAAVAPGPRVSVVPMPDPTIPCFFCQQVDSLGRMAYYWMHPECGGIIADHRPSSVAEEAVHV